MMKNFTFSFAFVAALLVSAAVSASALADAPAKRIVKDGVAVELSMAPLKDNNVEVRFAVRNAADGTPITGLNPIAWIDRHTERAATTDASCKAKIKSFLGGSLQARPDADLNTYAIITLNRDGTVAVIDPLLGFGGSKLLALVLLGAEGADWALTADQQTLFVSIPSLNEIAAVDTQTWKIAAHIAVGRKPQRVALQPDGGYLWVATDDGFSAIDVAERRAVAHVALPSDAGGMRPLAFSRDSRYVFAANPGAGSVAVIDVRDPKQVRTVATGKSPVALAYSALSNAVYAGHEDGTVVVIDAATHEVRNRVATGAGLRAIGFSLDGRWGFVVNSPANAVSVLDSSTNRVVQTIPVAGGPDKVAFTDRYAYIRTAGSHDVSMVVLASIGEGRQPAVSKFPGGQIAPEYASGPALPAAIVPAPEQGAVLLSNPADKTTYYYNEGMAAPMGSFQNYGREPLGVLAVNRNLREVQPGVYATAVRLDAGGQFDVPFLLDSPKITKCFDYSLALPSDLTAIEDKTPVKLERLFEPKAVAGARFQVRVRLVDGKTGRPLSDVKDLRMLTFTPGRSQAHTAAHPVGNGIYEATVVPPSSGVYYVFFESGSLGKTYQQMPHWVVTATAKQGRS